MDDSQKAREVAYIIDEKWRFYARTIAEQLRQEDFSANSGWEDLKLRLREKPDYEDPEDPGLDYHVDYWVERYCSRLLGGLAREELRLLWFGSEAADKAESPAFSRSTYIIELIEELYSRVQGLALEEDEGGPTLLLCRTSEEIVIPLADFLIRSDDATAFLRHELDSRVPIHWFRAHQDAQQVQEAVKDLLWNYPELLLPEQGEEALRLPKEERGKYLFDCLMENASNLEKL